MAYTTNEDTLLILPAAGVISNDTDASSLDTLSVTAFTGRSALGANIVLNANGSLSYDPTVSAYLQTLVTGESVQDSFTYTVNDGDGGTSTATVTITVTGQGGIEIDLTKQFPTSFAADPGKRRHGRHHGGPDERHGVADLCQRHPVAHRPGLGSRRQRTTRHRLHWIRDNDSLVLNRLASTNIRHITAGAEVGPTRFF
ncbi:MAG: cadherin-like domain-containing protein [Verrucomicrobiales bacterium]